jgi:hypothetical protein
MNQRIRKPLVVGAKPAAAASFYIRGPEPNGWHLGQKQVPRFCTKHCSMTQPQMGKEELRVPLFITPLVPLILRGRDCLLLG